MKHCVFGGQYGSEGKGAAAEFLAKTIRAEQPGGLLVVAGENAPNSGHTCSLGKTRNLPASSFYADYIILGPDAVIDPEAISEDIKNIQAKRVGRKPLEIIIHENAAWLYESDKLNERGVVERISSTGSGSGSARKTKYIDREELGVIGGHKAYFHDFIKVVNRFQFNAYVGILSQMPWIFECSQGVLLDTNWGIYPYVTSRTTLPRVAIERNGFGRFDWEYHGVYRTYPIRTGGPSGPTGGKEIKFSDIGKPDEIATVTKRTRRIFQFSQDDFLLSIQLARPNSLMFTHMDYLGITDHVSAGNWVRSQAGVDPLEYHSCLYSSSAGNFNPVP